MATVNVQATFCKSGAGVHALVTLRVNTVVQGVYEMELDDVTAPITDEEKRRFTSLFARIHLIGKTPAQLKAGLTSGITVTI